MTIVSFLARALALAPLLLLAACRSAGKPLEAPRPVPVGVAQCRLVQEPERVVVSGTVASAGGATLMAFTVPGRVVQVFPREGAFVRKGQVLAELDTTNLAHGLEASRAQRLAAEAQARRAQDEYLRMKQLFESQSLAPNDFAKFQAGRDGADQQVQQALAGEGVARKNLTEARLRAPLSGYVARRLVEPGAIVAPGQPVFELAVLDPIEIQVGVPETDLRLVRVGQAATVTAPALPGRSFKGRVKVVGIAAEPATRTYLTRISLPNPAHALKVGMVAEVAITGDHRVTRTLVPGEAVLTDPQGATQVYQYDPDQKRVFATDVTVGVLQGREVEIRSGLQGFETIVVAGQHGLRNGMAADPVVTAPR